MTKTARMEPGVKLRDAEKMALIPVKVLPTEPAEMLRKPSWLKITLPKSLSNSFLASPSITLSEGLNRPPFNNFSHSILFRFIV